MKTILVTGCAGFIGSRFTEIFNERYPDTQIVGIDNFSTGKKDRVHPSVKLYEGSITDVNLVEKIFAENNPEYVFHFAAMPRVAYCQEQPSETNITNIVGTSIVFEAATQHKTKRVIYSSSAAVYGNVKEMPVKEDTHTPAPISFYGFQKHTGEEIAQMLCKYNNIDIICLRYFNVYGPTQDGQSSYATVIARWLDAARDNHPITIEGDGTQSRDFVYLDDVVEANIAAMSAPGRITGDVFNIATHSEISLNEVRTMLEQELSKKLEVDQKPPREGDIKNIIADISKAESILSWKPKVSFEEGLKRSVVWYLNKK